jgi:hypothetical protein
MDYKIATFDASHPSIGATTNSRWLLTIEFNYFGGTAKNTNSVALSVYTSTTTEYSYYKWSQTHVVNFASSFGQKFSHTLPIYFQNDTKLYIEAYTESIPPSGKNYKIGLISLQFTRLA